MYPLPASPYWPSHYWQWRGHRIHYIQAGSPDSNHPPILFVHGFGASTDHWKKNMAQLQLHYPVWAIDLLGFGRSAKPAVEYSGSLWRDQLADFVQEHIGQPVILVGNSLGGYASLCAAAEVPQTALGVALLNSAGPFTPDPAEAASAEPSKGQTAWKNFTRNVVSHPWITRLVFWNLRRRAMVRKTLKQVYFNPAAVTDELVEDILRPAFDAGAFQVFASVFRSPQGAKVDELLLKLPSPLLLIWGEKDPWIKARERSAKFKQYAPHCTEHFLESGHCPHDESPEAVNQLLDEWIRSLPAPLPVTG